MREPEMPSGLAMAAEFLLLPRGVLFEAIPVGSLKYQLSLGASDYIQPSFWSLLHPWSAVKFSGTIFVVQHMFREVAELAEDKLEEVMAEHRYLQRAKNVLQDLQRSQKDVRLNVEQCEYLGMKLTETLMELDRLICSLRPAPAGRFGLNILRLSPISILTKFVDTIPSLIHVGDYASSLSLVIEEEIFNVIKRAEWLVKECCDERWLLKALEVTARAEIREIYSSLAELLPCALSTELDIDPSQCDPHFLDTMKGLVKNLTEGIRGDEVEKELEKRSTSDTMVLLSMLGKAHALEEELDFANTGLARLVKDRYTSGISSNWLLPEISSSMDFDGLNVHGARSYTTLQCFGKKYSLLTLNLDCASASEFIEGVCQEASLWKKCQHPYIISLMGHWKIKPKPYLLYEFMDLSLEKLITQVRAVREIVPLEMVEMMLPVAKAIKHLHDQDIAHQGINTENILCIVEQEDFNLPLHDVTVKLRWSDKVFRKACPGAQDRNWESASITEFTAPEILLQNTSIDLMKADVFSFGMVMLKAFTGQAKLNLALGGGSSIMQFRPEPWMVERSKLVGMLPTLLGNIIESCCLADPNQRPTFDDICRSLLFCKLQLLSQKRSGIIGSAQATERWMTDDIVVHKPFNERILSWIHLIIPRIQGRFTSSVASIRQSFKARSLNMKGEDRSDSFLLDKVEFIKMIPQLISRTNFGIERVIFTAQSDNNELESLRTAILQCEIHMPVSFQMMNTHQCQLLCDYVASIQVMLANLEDEMKKLPNPLANLEFIFEELVRVLKRTKLLVDGCCIGKWSPEAIILVHCEEYFWKVYWELHLWMEVIEAFDSDLFPPRATDMAKKILALYEAAARDHKLNMVMLNNHEMQGLESTELNMVSHLYEISSQSRVVHKSWRPPSFKQDIVLDLSEDLLGVSPNGWVIKIKWIGSCYALKRVNKVEQFGIQPPVLTSLWHPHIVQLINYWEEKGKLFMLMEYMECRDLANFFTKKVTLSLHVVIDILVQVANGVYYLHNKGVAHNDLKCCNILMTPDPNQKGSYIVKLGGFGSAKKVPERNIISSQTQQRNSWPLNVDVFKKDVYDYGSICDESLLHLLPSEHQSKPSRFQEIYDSTIQYVKICIRMCQREDPLQRPNCAKILRLLSLAQLQALGSITVHTNEFYCLCMEKTLLRCELEAHSQEELIHETMDEELAESVTSIKQLVEEPIIEPVVLNKPLWYEDKEPSRRLQKTPTSNEVDANQQSMHKKSSYDEIEEIDILSKPSDIKKTTHCQVEGCKADLNDCNIYYWRHKVCKLHYEALTAIVAGIEQRFCFLCSRFHALTEFKKRKHRCRRRLVGCNRQQRERSSKEVLTQKKILSEF